MGIKKTDKELEEQKVIEEFYKLRIRELSEYIEKLEIENNLLLEKIKKGVK